MHLFADNSLQPPPQRHPLLLGSGGRQGRRPPPKPRGDSRHLALILYGQRPPARVQHTARRLANTQRWKPLMSALPLHVGAKQ